MITLRKHKNAPHARTSQVSKKWVRMRTSQLATAHRNSQLAIAHRKSCFGNYRQFFKISNRHNLSIILLFISNLLRAISQARVTSVSPLVNWLKVSTINNKTMNFKIISDFIVPNLGLFVQLTATLQSSPGERTYLVSLISRIENQFFQGH